MPYKLVEGDGGWYVENEDSGKRKNKKPLPRARAVKYMRALYAVEGGDEMRGKEIHDQVMTAFKRIFDKNTGGGVDRDKLETSDFIDPERRRFPIVTASDVMDAVHSYGRAKPQIPFEQFKSRLIAIAKRKGFTASLPKDWKVEEKEVTTKSIGSMIESQIHSDFTNRADSLYGSEQLTRDERIILSSAIGDALDAFVKRVKKDAPKLYAKSLGDTPMTYPEWKESKPSLMIYKDAAGQDRWVLFSSNAYRDRDEEIVSTAALEADVARADKEGNYGPLRWWHVGKPDPIKQVAGPGLDIGKCDFRAMHGRVLVESGTFNGSKMAQAIKEDAGNLQVSVGFFHPRTEPDAAGVFNSIKIFERSLLPAGRASNPFTAVSVIQKSDGGSEMISEKIKAFAALLKDDELVQTILAQAEAKEKEAQEVKAAFKGEDPAPAAPVVEQPEETVKDEPVEVVADEPEVEEDYQPLIGDMSPDAFAGLLAEAMGKAIEPYANQIKELQTGMKTKDDSEAALRGALELQAQSIQSLKSQLDELTGSQPRAAAKGYRDSQSADTVVKEDSRVKGQKPTVDPDFIKMFVP